MMTICKNGMEIGAFDTPRRKVPVLGIRDGKSGVVSVAGYFRSEELADEFVSALAAMCGAHAVQNGRSADWIYQYRDCGLNGWIIDEASTKAIRQHGETLNPKTLTLSQAISVYINAAACDTELAGKQKEKIAKWLVELRDRRLNDVAPGVAPSGTCCRSAAWKAGNAAGWIPCSEKQPENAGPALVYLGGGCIEVDCWNGEKWIDCGGEIMHPVFWMPLPETPEAAATSETSRGGNAAADQAERSGADSIADAANVCQQVHAELWRLFDRLRGALADEAVLRADRLHTLQIAADQMLHTADTVRTAQKLLILSAAKDQAAEPEMQKIRHAAWIHEPDYHETVCSLCSAVSPNGLYWRYCHHCGARMDRKEGAGNDKP